MPVSMSSNPAKETNPSLIEMNGKGWELTSSTVDGNDVLIRIFNAEGDAQPQKIVFGCKAEKVELVELSGSSVKELKPEKTKDGKMSVTLSIPHFGIRTLKLMSK